MCECSTSVLACCFKTLAICLAKLNLSAYELFSGHKLHLAVQYCYVKSLKEKEEDAQSFFPKFWAFVAEQAEKIGNSRERVP